MKACRWEFLLSNGVAVLIQGSGGQIGNAALHIDLSDNSTTRGIANHLLQRAQLQAKREGGVRAWDDNEIDPSKRISFLKEVQPVACRPVMQKNDANPYGWFRLKLITKLSCVES